MGKRKIKLGSTITLDEEKEKDTIDFIESMLRSHKLGEFISNLLRIAVDKPTALENRQRLIAVARELEEYGMTEERAKFFKNMSRELLVMKEKVDAMYEMNLKLMCLAQYGKHIGLEAKTENSLMAQFMLEKQINDICHKLGINHLNHVFESNKCSGVKDKAEDILAYILETYDNIISESRNSIYNEISMRGNFVPVQNAMAVNEADIKKEEPVVEETTKEDEYVDFGNADISSIENMLGGL